MSSLFNGGILAKKKPTSSIDVLSHFLVPEMKIIEDSEKKRILKKFGITPEKLPRMLIGDPAVQSLKANVGDIIAINRTDLTGNYIAYKIVVSGSGK